MATAIQTKSLGAYQSEVGGKEHSWLYSENTRFVVAVTNHEGNDFDAIKGQLESVMPTEYAKENISYVNYDANAKNGAKPLVQQLEKSLSLEAPRAAYGVKPINPTSWGARIRGLIRVALRAITGGYLRLAHDVETTLRKSSAISMADMSGKLGPASTKGEKQRLVEGSSKAMGKLGGKAGKHQARDEAQKTYGKSYKGEAYSVLKKTEEALRPEEREENNELSESLKQREEYLAAKEAQRSGPHK